MVGVAGGVAEADVEDAPDQASGRVPRQEDVVGEAGVAGDGGHEGAQDPDEPSEEDGPSPLLAEVAAGPLLVQEVSASLAAICSSIHASMSSSSHTAREFG